jgi:hypothetical protein
MFDLVTLVRTTKPNISSLICDFFNDSVTVIAGSDAYLHRLNIIQLHRGHSAFVIQCWLDPKFAY